jgi:hypothetical protein
MGVLRDWIGKLRRPTTDEPQARPDPFSAPPPRLTPDEQSVVDERKRELLEEDRELLKQDDAKSEHDPDRYDVNP